VGSVGPAATVADRAGFDCEKLVTDRKTMEHRTDENFIGGTPCWDPYHFVNFQPGMSTWV
jgi:hypothetical protein